MSGKNLSKFFFQFQNKSASGPIYKLTGLIPHTVQVKCMSKIRGEIKGFESKPHLVSLQTEDGKEF